MNFTKSSCTHVKFEKSFLSVYSCKKCSTTQLVTLPKVLKKKHKDIFFKPLEYCFNYEINIIELIKNQIHNDEKNFKNYKEALENISKNEVNTNKNLEINDSFYSNNEQEKSEESSYNSEKTNDENDFLHSLNIYYKNRKDIITQIKKLCNKHSTSKNCFYLTMTLIEEFFKISDTQKINNYQMDLIINAIFILVYKYIDSDNDFFLNYKSFKTFFYKEKRHIKSNDLKIAEIQCLQILEYNLNILTILNFLELMLSSGIILEKETDNFNIISKTYSECLNLLDFCFNENDIMIQHSMSEIVLSIISLVRKQNNLIFNIDKYFAKIYNIELKKYFNCIKHISSIYYKNENVCNNLFVLNDERKEFLLSNKSEKKFKFDINDNEINGYKRILKPIFKKINNTKFYISNSCDGRTLSNKNLESYDKKNKISILSSKPKSKSIIINQDKNDTPYNVKIFQYNIKEKDKEIVKKNNSIVFDCSIINKNLNNDKPILKPLNPNLLKSSRNFINMRYKNVSNNNSSISTHNNSNNNEVKNKLIKNSSNVNSVDINRASTKYLYSLRDSTNSNNSNNLIKVSSSNNLLESLSNINNISNSIKLSNNDLRKSFEIQNKIKNTMAESNDLSGKKEINYYFNNSNRNNEFNIRNKQNIRIKLNKNKDSKKNLFKLNNKIYNINEGNIKLPLIKKSL